MLTRHAPNFLSRWFDNKENSEKSETKRRLLKARFARTKWRIFARWNIPLSKFRTRSWTRNSGALKSCSTETSAMFKLRSLKLRTTSSIAAGTWAGFRLSWKLSKKGFINFLIGIYCTLGVSMIKVYTWEFQISRKMSQILSKISQTSWKMSQNLGESKSNFR